MKYVIVILLTCLLAVSAQAVTPSVPERAAKAALRDTLAPLLTSRAGSAPVRVRRCRGIGRGWYACTAVVSGTERCVVSLRVRPANGNYRAWASRIRCR